MFAWTMLSMAVLTLMGLTGTVRASIDQRLSTVQTWEDYEAITSKEAKERKLRRRMQTADSEPLLADYYGGTAGFYHGIASGDPMPNAIILWTRFTPVAVTDEVTLELRIAKIDSSIPVDAHLTPGENPDLRRATVVVTSDSDWVAKIDMTGLDPATAYVFAFTDGTVSSDVGYTKTAPADGAPTDQMTYAAFSCAAFGNGWFHPYDIASTIKDLDFWVHLGDYVVRIQTSSLSVCRGNENPTVYRIGVCPSVFSFVMKRVFRLFHIVSLTPGRDHCSTFQHHLLLLCLNCQLGMSCIVRILPGF